MLLIHATCVAIEGHGLLLRGPSGAGKSDLALRLIDHGAKLVADDQVCLRADGGRLIASAPRNLQGRLEIRGLGPVPLPDSELMRAVPVTLIADLVAAGELPRLPDPAYETLLGCRLPWLAAEAFSGAAPIKLRRALARAAEGTLFIPAEAERPEPLPPSGAAP
jgi:HPr kinase/phosphorylase